MNRKADPPDAEGPGEDDLRAFGDDDGESETLPCPNCGESVYEDGTRCPHCGQYVAMRSGSAGWPWWVLAAALAAMGALAIWQLL